MKLLRYYTYFYRFLLKIPCIIILYHREVRYSFMKDVFISDWHLLNRRGPRHTTLFQANLSALKQYSIHNLLSAPQGSHTAKPLQLNSLYHREVHYLAKVKNINASHIQFCTPRKWNLTYPKDLHFHTISLAKQEFHTVIKLCVMLQCGYVSSLPSKQREKKKNEPQKKGKFSTEEILHRTYTSNSFSFCKHTEFSLHETVLFAEYESSFTIYAISKLWI